ncbi:facilitated trehalose transporter Tret1-like [Phymastichus coffea]|uniref:facilitated trehalose transporter Tret1-like n=1 Tax=Phymastichus coffea TaxID=108790 RepID=UPI00273CCAC6|nr:facilitated trehalose transporter Tret1-like [Phymastichus coffea]
MENTEERPVNPPKEAKIAMDDRQQHQGESQFKRTLSQFCAIAASSLLTLSLGMSIGFSTILIPELYRENAEVIVTIEELTWISSLNYFAIPLGAISSGPISHYFGRRTTLTISTIPYIGSWLLLRFSGSHVWPIFLGFLMLGATGGVVEAPVQVYVTEISEPRLRGSISASVSATILLGIFLQVLFGSFMYWRTLALANLAFPVAAFVALCLVPESPYWLANRNRHDEAQCALAWLRGWTTPASVTHEFQTILDSSTAKHRHHDESSWTRYFRRSVLVPFAIVSFAFFIGCFNGSISVQTYAVLMFNKLDSPVDDHTAAIILTGLQLIASVLLVFIVPKAGKRKPILASLAVAGLSVLLVAVCAFLRDHKLMELKTTGYSWIPSIAVVIAIVATALGIKSIPWILAGEVFSNDVRGVATGLVGSTCNIYAALASKIFLYMLDEMTLAGSFLFFAFVNLIGILVLYWTLPETEGKTLAEIQRQFSVKKKA